MIKVLITEKKGVLESILIKGHANYDIYGKDIVCASVSALTLCTINNISALEDNTIKITMNDNEFKIEIIKVTKINTKLLNNMIKLLKELASKSNNRTYYNKTEKIENLIEQNYYVDLIFTVNMVNMGYHVDNITGIMMLRATKSEITFYQQLGRALSVNASHNPIVIDSVNNIYEEFWFKKNAKRKDSTTDNSEVDNNKETNNNIKIDIQYLKSYDAFEQFMQRFCTDEYNSEEIELDFLYNDRQMPLFILASYKGITCKELIKKLIQYKINIRKEDEEYNFVYNNCLSLKQSNNKKDTMQEVNKLRFINSKKATYGNCSLIKNKQTTTMYDMLNK